MMRSATLEKYSIFDQTSEKLRGMKRIGFSQSQEMAGQTRINKMQLRHPDNSTLGAVANVGMKAADYKHHHKYLHIPLDGFVILRQIIGYLCVFDEITSCQAARPASQLAASVMRIPFRNSSWRRSWII